MHLADYRTYTADTAQSVKTITITKDTNARDAAAIANVIGTLKQGSTVQLDSQQSPIQATARGRRYHFYLVTVQMPAADSAPTVTTGMRVYLYAGCFPADTFTAVEKPKLPGYWKATVTGKSKEPMRIYDSKAHCMQRNVPPVTVLNPEQPCTFQTEKIIKNVAIKGKSHSIAKCQFPASATFRGDPISSGWMIVDESQVTWERVEPTEFDSIVKFTEPMPIAAGDPIGLMGIWESPEPPFITGMTKTRHQMHIELFTTDDKTALEAFLSNSAGLTTGKKYLKVPKGSQLYSSDGHGNFVNPDPLLNAARDYVFEESACRQVKDTAGTVFYHLKGIKTGEAATGPVDFAHVKLEGNIKLVTQHDWQALGFTTIEETNDDSDGYINPEKITSPLFQDIFKRVDGINSRNGQGDGVLTGTEIRNALQQDKELRSDLYKMIAGHPSEWHQATQNNMKAHADEQNTDNAEEYKNTNQFEVERFLQCEFVSQIEGLTQKLWHFHPVQLISIIKNIRYWPLGKTSEYFESGGRGPGTISSGNGDHGGASYGIYQLSSRMGKLQEYINYSKFKENFDTLDLCSESFNLMWKKIAREYADEFKEEQHNFIRNTTYKTQINILSEKGVLINHKRAAIHDMVWSTSVQMGQNTKLILRALENKNVNTLNDVEIISLVQDYKADNVESIFRSSPTLWDSLRSRAVTEKERLIYLASTDYMIEDL
ncbi:hypothetical protein [Tolumonas osonensis]|uniref:Type VI secretion system spike protein VgrG3-like C-terminal domain-containing protein n=1 Tax=Tolumonas osonensis TaxID=675874 RepID=A0A841GG37_9GAMM|nr:hypothetical protein [Tolumonas osonensis]MBB6056929.1 hypothetical protein [Tolumonas osonensis]